MVFMNCRDGEAKLQSVVDALTDCDRGRSYYLSVATCYCTPQAVHEFIEAIQARVNLAEIYLYVDRRTAISIGQEVLSDLQNTYPDLLYVYAVRTGRLFHTKGYCLAAYDGDDLVDDSRLAIGSANLTCAGLTEVHGNIESLAIHTDIETIEGFLNFFDNEDSLITPDELTDFSMDDTTDFQYALLTSGWFSHKLSATLATYFSVRYHLNEEGRRLAQEGIRIKIPGFQMAPASIGKRYVKDKHFKLQDGRQSNGKGLIRNYGIECSLGHWIPKSVVGKEKNQNKRFRKFKTGLFKMLDSKMKRICRKILRDYEYLNQQGIIDVQDVNPTQTFLDRIEALRNDNDQLYRIWSGRSFFEFPYDPGKVEKIQETFDDILLTARRRRHKNTSMRAVVEAEQRWTLEPLQTLLDADR